MVVASDASSGTRELTQETGTSWLDREVVPSANVHARFVHLSAAELAMCAAAELAAIAVMDGRVNCSIVVACAACHTWATGGQTR